VRTGGVVAIGHGRRLVRLHDVPCFGRPVRLLWAKRIWRCPETDCPRTTFTEEHPLAGPRAKLTARAVTWATDALARFDTSVSALAHQLGVSWHTVWDAVRAEAARRVGAADRLQGVDALGVDEHVWSHTGPPGTGMVTGIVDHTRDANGGVHARLLDLVPGAVLPTRRRRPPPLPDQTHQPCLNAKSRITKLGKCSST
jgi:transposase